MLGSTTSSGALVHAPTLTPAQPSTVESTSLLTELELSKLISDLYREHTLLAMADGDGLSLATSIQQHYLRQCGLQALADEQVGRLVHVHAHARMHVRAAAEARRRAASTCIRADYLSPHACCMHSFTHTFTHVRKGKDMHARVHASMLFS